MRRKNVTAIALAAITLLLLLQLKSLVYDVTRCNVNDTVTTSIINRTKTSQFKFGSPFIIVTEGGCSGSTAVGGFISDIIHAHGMKKVEKVGFEFLNTNNVRKNKNGFFYDIAAEKNMTNKEANEPLSYQEIMIESLKRAQLEGKQSKQLLFFKANVRKFRQLQSFFDSMEGVSYVGMYRKNILDRCICMVKDCFWEAKSFGHPVFADNGTRTDTCFDRRFHPEIQFQAHLTDAAGCIHKGQKIINFINRTSSFATSTEKLLEFEYSVDDGVFESSMEAWANFLQPLLKHELDKDLIKVALRRYRGSRTHNFQEGGIKNYDEVASGLVTLGMGSFLREKSNLTRGH